MFNLSDLENGTQLVSKDALRTAFTIAISDLYAREVPLYSDLLSLTDRVNATPDDKGSSDGHASLAPHKRERHGAIRVGTAAELQWLRRGFDLLGMYPVGYYDLSTAGIPVHSTAFRPIENVHLEACPFRVFTSLLRLEFIEDMDARTGVSDLLSRRNIISAQAQSLIEKAEINGGLGAADAAAFVVEFLQTFVWHGTALVSQEDYAALLAIHPLIADIVAFPGPHINHLTPITRDIDAAHAEMGRMGMPTKAVIEGPPPRDCPILLRQTSFRALSEHVTFPNGTEGKHTARFGEIEARGVALTLKGQALYDRLLGQTRANILPAGDGSNAREYESELASQFSDFPDDWASLDAQGLAYFRKDMVGDNSTALLPVKYEDFLPISAAGIFQSNLGSDDASASVARPQQARFEDELGAQTHDKYALYQAQAGD